ncbi:TPA: hypothetical protein QEM96_002762 [Pseudomonas putida]|nr:hypothetical protein [Pseudomonas putida]
MNNSTKQSLEDFLKEMAKARKNYDYPVIVAFDRKTTNHVLKQEFIERYSNELFVAPMNSELDLEPGVSYHQLLDFCLDEPRLSFENADLSDSKAVLMMRTVRGKHLQLSKPLGSSRKRVTRLAEATPINGPSLVFDIELDTIVGQVSEGGSVYFSLAAGKNYAFYGGASQYEMDKLGLHFKNYFEAYTTPPENRIFIEYTLGQIANLADSALKLNRFAIRTHGAPETGLRNTESFGDGAVVLFVELEGFDSENAVPPDENHKLPYLLPRDYSSNVLINTDFIAKNLIIPELKKSSTDIRQLQWTSLLAGGLGYRATGTLPVPGFEFYYGDANITFTCEQADYACPPEHEANKKFKFEIKNNKLVVEWRDELVAQGKSVTKHWGQDPIVRTGEFISSWTIGQTYNFSIENSKLTLEKTSEEYNFNLRVTGELGELVHNSNKVYNLCYNALEPKMKEFLSDIASGFSKIDVEIDSFILSSLLFRNSQIALESAHWPNDLVALGQLAPERNKFNIIRSDNKPIDKGETSVLPGARLTFKTDSVTQGVTWSVRHLPDYTGDNPPGEINATTGAYTAPAANTFNGSHIKVLVTAKKGGDASHILLTVLRTPVNVFPTIMTVNLNGYDDITAGEMNGGVISMDLKGLGRLEDNPTPDPLAQDSKRYYAPSEVPAWEEGMPPVDEVMRLDQVVVSSDGLSKTIHILLPVETEGSYWLKPIPHGAGVKLEFWRKPRNRPEEQVPADDTSWYVRVGNGTIAGGVYTPHASKPDEDCIVIVAIDESQMLVQYASMIVPIPFIDAEQFVSLYESVEASDKARRLRLNQK